jgi:hypothetical protein
MGKCMRWTYGNHGQQDVTRSGGLEGRNGRVDKRIDGRCGEDEAGGEEANDLLKSASASCSVGA